MPDVGVEWNMYKTLHDMSSHLRPKACVEEIDIRHLSWLHPKVNVVSIMPVYPLRELKHATCLLRLKFKLKLGLKLRLQLKPEIKLKLKKTKVKSMLKLNLHQRSKLRLELKQNCSYRQSLGYS